MGHGHLSGPDDGTTEMVAGYPVEERDDFYLVFVDLCGGRMRSLKKGRMRGPAGNRLFRSQEKSKKTATHGRPRGWCVGGLKDEVNGLGVLANNDTAPGVIPACEEEIVCGVCHRGDGDNTALG